MYDTDVSNAAGNRGFLWNLLDTRVSNMQPTQQSQPSGFLGCFTACCVVGGVVLATSARVEAVLLMVGLLWCAVALPYLFVVGLIREGKKPKAKVRPAKAAAAAAKTPSRAELMAAAREKYEATLAMLEASGLDADEIRAAKRKARALYMREIDSIMGG